MKLGLSTAAAPDLPLEGLVEACRRRGLGALELATGHGHGLSAQSPDHTIRLARQLTTLRDVKIAAVTAGNTDIAEREAAVALASRLRVPVSVNASAGAPEDLAQLAADCRDSGLLLLHGSTPSVVTDLLSAIGSLPASSARLAWEIDPAADDPADIDAVLDLATSHLGLIRLRGGGPEAQAQTGLGVGALIGRLALARYDRPIILTPTTPRHHLAWSAWLGRRGGWGCGSKQADSNIVPLTAMGGTRSGVL